MPKMEKYLYNSGGPIILVQVENEYGAFGCDSEFRALMRDETEKYVSDKAVLFTNDIPDDVGCGKIPNVLATLDFGKGKNKVENGIEKKEEFSVLFTCKCGLFTGNRSAIDELWKKLRKVQPNGPLVNAEFYPGWFTHWQEPNSIVETDSFIDTFQ